MDSAQYFSLVKGKIDSFDEEKVHSPSMPITIFIQKSEIQNERAKQDLQDLTRVRFQPQKLEDIPALLGALRHLSSAWTDVQFDKPETRKLWQEKQARGEVLRFELSEAISFAFHDDEVMMAKLQAIDRGGSNADNIQELNDLFFIASNNKEKLIQVTELTNEVIKESGEIAMEMGQIYAKVVVDESTSPEVRILRDKVYTMIEDIMKEIERSAHYAFRNYPQKASLFNFSYKALKKKSKAVTSKKPEVAPATVTA